MLQNRTRSSISIVVLAIGLSIAISNVVVAQNADGVRVLQSDQREMLVEITPKWSVTRLPGGEVVPVVAGAMVENRDKPGEPMRMRLTIPIALPSQSGTTVEVVSAEYSTPVDGRIAPVPAYRRGSDGMPEPNYVVDQTAYSRPIALGPVATLTYFGVAREVHSGGIQVSPYIYDAAAGSVRFLTRATVRMRYPSVSTAPGRGASMSRLTRSAFANGEAATSWTIAAPMSRGIQRRSSIATARAWMRVEVKEDGLYALTAEDFQKAGIDIGSVDPARLAIYGGDGGDLPEKVSAIDSNRMQQVPAIIERGGDGKLSRVLFYGVGPGRWQVRPNDTLPAHKISPYVLANSYIVAVDGDAGRSFPAAQAPAGYDVTPQYGITRLFYDEDKINAIDVDRNGSGSGRGWFGTAFTVDPADRTTDTRAFMMHLPGLERSAPIIYRVRVADAGRDRRDGGTYVNGAGTFKFSQQDVQIGNPVTVGPIGGEFQTAVATERTFFVPNANAVPGDNRSSLSIKFESAVASSGFLDYYEIHYGRRLEADNNRIVFDAPSGIGNARFRVTGFSNDDLIGFDITDPANPLQLERKEGGEAGVFTFYDQLRLARDSRRYFITDRGSVQRVAASAKAAYGELRTRARDADVLVVTHEDFRKAAQTYVDFRASQGRLRASFVTVDEIYTEFSHGNLDPTAIRDYIGYAMRNWTVKPQYVLFIGDATYDYRNLATTQKQFVPTYESEDGDSYDDTRSSGYDDYFGRVIGEDGMLDLVTGRFPVDKSEQAEMIVEKVRSYETSRNFGAWRNTVVLTADDANPDNAGTDFVRQSESLSQYDLPAWIEPKKVYLPAYPTEQVSTRRKPGATADLMQFINRGALVTNWIGHGNPKQWAHELLLENDQFIPRLTNDSALTFVTAATCNFGYFDDPGQVSGAERFLLQSGGGAVAVMSSARASFIFQNEGLITSYYDVLFRRDPSTGQFPSIGGALMYVKVKQGNGQDNDQKYHIFGDPSMQLAYPEDIVRIDSINSVATATDTAVVGALSMVNVEGVVTDPSGAIRSDYNGTAVVTLFDADRSTTVVEMVGPNRYEHGVKLFGGRLFRGPARVVNGRFRSTFRVPKDISYDSATARLHVYAYTSDRDAIGATSNLRVFGSDSVMVTDTAGPAIKVFIDDRSFSSGDLVTPQPILIVDLSDTSGINSAGSGLGHKIEAWIDNQPNSIDLTEFYQTGLTDYRIGSAERRLLELLPGEHRVRVRAWDIFNNPSETTTLFRIAEGGDTKLQVVDVVNYPNPMARETEFTFRHNQSRPLDVTVAIFSTSGRKIRELEARSVVDRFVRIHWDGTDADGAPLANGVYFYRLRVNVIGSDQEQSFETIEKVAVVR